MRAHHDRRGDAAGADTVVIQERVKNDGDADDRSRGAEKGAERALRRRGPEGGGPCCARQAAQARRPRPHRLARHRRGRGEAQAARRVLRHRRRARLDRRAAQGRRGLRLATATRCTACSRGLGVEIIDMGVVRDDPARSRSVSARRRESRRRHHDRRRVGRRSRLRQAADGRSSARCCSGRSRCARPADGVRQDRRRVLLRPARQPGGGDGHLLPVRARRAAPARGRDDVRCRCSRRAAARRLRKVPGGPSTSAASCSAKDGEWKVRTTGQQGSGVLRSMSEANCFIVLEHERGAVQGGGAGERAAIRRPGVNPIHPRARAARARREGDALAGRGATPAHALAEPERGCGPSTASAIRRATCATCSTSIRGTGSSSPRSPGCRDR